MISLLAAILALQTTAPASSRELSEIVGNTGICAVLGYAVDYVPMEAWANAIVRADAEGITMERLMGRVDSDMVAFNERQRQLSAAVTNRTEHNALIDRQVSFCEDYLTRYPALVKRMPTTNTTIATFRQ